MFLSWVNVTVTSYVDLLWYLNSSVPSAVCWLQVLTIDDDRLFRKPVEKKTDDKPQLQLAAKSFVALIFHHC